MGRRNGKAAITGTLAKRRANVMMLVFIFVAVGFAVMSGWMRDRFRFPGSRHTQLMVMGAGYARQNHQIARP